MRPAAIRWADTPWKTGKTQEEKEMAAMIGLPSDKMLPEDDECLECAPRFSHTHTHPNMSVS